MLALFDLFFVVLHSALILFNMFAWIPAKTRKLNLIFLLGTGFSWTVLGIFFGLGYCPLTDWHYKVLIKLGESNLPHSYIQYMVQRFFSLQISPFTADILTVSVYLVALACSLWVNLRKR